MNLLFKLLKYFHLCYRLMNHPWHVSWFVIGPHIVRLHWKHMKRRAFPSCAVSFWQYRWCQSSPPLHACPTRQSLGIPLSVASEASETQLIQLLLAYSDTTKWTWCSVTFPKWWIQWGQSSWPPRPRYFTLYHAQSRNSNEEMLWKCSKVRKHI